MPDWFHRIQPVRDNMLSSGLADEEQALRVMREDPAVQGRIFRAELFPFGIALPQEKKDTQ